MKMKITDLTLRGQLTKMKDGFGDDMSWTRLSDKELKQSFLDVIKYYKEREKYLSKSELEYLKELEKVNKIVYGN